jgi:ubiquinone/menaquinone biosynthesis C-methylase UbiE
MEWLVGEMDLLATDIVADIGAGLGSMSKLFLENGNVVHAIEPNPAMFSLAKKLLAPYRYANILLAQAERTTLPADSVDYIVCGNAYFWFDKALAISEFTRILKTTGKVLITHYYPDENSPGIEKMNHLYAMLKGQNVDTPKTKTIGGEFLEGRYTKKVFSHTYRQNIDQFLCGNLSSAFAPLPGDVMYDDFVDGLKSYFALYSEGEKLESTFHLTCLIGDVNDLR